MVRLGLCCIFKQEPIKFRQTTAKALLKLDRQEQLTKLSKLCLHNLQQVEKALRWITSHDIGAFRILSPLFPRITHPEVCYHLEELPDYALIMACSRHIREFRKNNDLRLSLHPDQFNVLNSPDPKVVLNTLRELEYQGMLAELLDIEVINMHGGGVYGNKQDAMKRLCKNFGRLSTAVQSRLTLENDDRSYSPSDLLPVCQDLEIPFVYDIHHHRCLPDSRSVAEITEACISTWSKRNEEAYFHISSPLNGYESANPRPHADFIDIDDFPETWLEGNITIDVEAKAKELAVRHLQEQLRTRLARQYSAHLIT